MEFQGWRPRAVYNGHKWTGDPINGCQTGTKHPILHVKQDQVYPIGFRDGRTASSCGMCSAQGLKFVLVKWVMDILSA
jgi:hypothetical protein